MAPSIDEDTLNVTAETAMVRGMYTLCRLCTRLCAISAFFSLFTSFQTPWSPRAVCVCHLTRLGACGGSRGLRRIDNAAICTSVVVADRHATATWPYAQST